jgi:hypothetical protein
MWLVLRQRNTNRRHIVLVIAAVVAALRVPQTMNPVAVKIESGRERRLRRSL